MPGKIFISYRRDDAADAAARLADGLAARFGRADVFMDVDNLLPGQRFDKKLAEALDACDVLIAVVGPRWMELVRARERLKAETGEPDYVRAEIGEALRRGIVVIPVRVGREGQMPPLPRRDELPADIRDLVLHQKHDVAHERFGRDLAELAQAIMAVRSAQRPPGPLVPWRWVAAGAGAVVALAVLYLIFGSGPSEEGHGGTPKVAVTPQKPQPEPAPKPVAPPPKLEPVAPPPPPKPEPVFSPNRAVGPLTAAEERTINPGHSFRECAVCPEMVVVPSGSFTMGSPTSEEGREYDEGSPRRVTIARPFAVGKFEVTFAEWDTCVAEVGCRHNPTDDDGWGRDRRPVINVSWVDITREYLPWLARKTGKAYRLLTEAEWEYAARADTTTAFWWGSSISTSQANYHGKYTYGGGAKGEYRQRSVPVGSFAPNPWGLFNVHGNVWEWVQDCYGDPKDLPSDASATETLGCTSRILRGGSWLDHPNYLRSAYRRGGDSPSLRLNNFGFRVGRTL